MLQLSAELDGQQYLSKQALGLVDTVETAAKLGLRHAATFQPNLIVEGEAACKAPHAHTVTRPPSSPTPLWKARQSARLLHTFQHVSWQ